MIDLQALTAPFASHEIEWRVGATNKEKTKGMALAYMDARAVMERLDRVCGPENWQCEYPYANGKTCCRIGIKFAYRGETPIHEEWVWKSDGAGDTDFEGAKGAFSDAFKRAAVRWGIGRYLYGLDAPWVEIQARGKGYVLTDESIKKLTREYEDKHWWQGPLGRVALKKGVEDFAKALNDIATPSELDSFVSQNNALLVQCEHDKPGWYFGQGDGVGLQQRISDRVEVLNPQATR